MPGGHEALRTETGLGEDHSKVMPSYLGNELVSKTIPYPCFHQILLTLLWKDQVDITIFILHMRNMKMCEAR